MLAIPMSSPQITRMFGLDAAGAGAEVRAGAFCAATGRADALPSAASSRSFDACMGFLVQGPKEGGALLFYAPLERSARKGRGRVTDLRTAAGRRPRGGHRR